MAVISHHFRYLRVVLRHKWYVFLAGRKLQVPFWQLVIHDLSKFGRHEWPAYVERFGSGRAGRMDKSEDTQAFRDAWEHHWTHNKHHWEFACVWEDGHFGTRAIAAIEMPEHYAREMVADWNGASRVYSGKADCSEWYAAHRDKIVLHPATREFVEGLMND